MDVKRKGIWVAIEGFPDESINNFGPAFETAWAFERRDDLYKSIIDQISPCKCVGLPGDSPIGETYWDIKKESQYQSIRNNFSCMTSLVVADFCDMLLNPAEGILAKLEEGINVISYGYCISTIVDSLIPTFGTKNYGPNMKQAFELHNTWHNIIHPDIVIHETINWKGLPEDLDHWRKLHVARDVINTMMRVWSDKVRAVDFLSGNLEANLLSVMRLIKPVLRESESNP